MTSFRIRSLAPFTPTNYLMLSSNTLRRLLHFPPIGYIYTYILSWPIPFDLNSAIFTKMIQALLILLAAIAVTVSANNSTVHAAPVTVPELVISEYLGLWYQMYADAIVYASFEKDAYCATALYGDNGDNTVSVHNYAKIGAPDGQDYVIDGYAYQTDAANEPGQLKVHFDSSDGKKILNKFYKKIL